ncbi:hypothetical protein [Nocardia sp. NPDC046763]|uniref:hypothetical protein n=1 Tax=Nocardia sp. NPDC046763 TaxID=3155256 RepID=UPI003400FC14
MKYRVTAPLVVAPDHGGRANHWYYGQIIQALPDEAAAHLLGLDMVEQVVEPVPPGVIAPEATEVEQVPVSAEEVPAESPARPPQTATKEVWVEYAVSALGLDQAEAEAKTKDELKALAG